ncbi:MAG: hypothetical protein ABW136_04480 [Steroidobacteraceae bacterium]
MKLGMFGVMVAMVAGVASAAQPIPRGFVEVRPVTRGTQAPVAPLELGNTQFFSYALPPGWRLGESGQFAFTLLAPDSKALTLMVGNAGVPINYPPAQFVYEKLMAIQPQALQLSPPRAAKPLAGFAQAVEYQVSYSVNGVPCRGIATLHFAPAYDTAVMAMTAALSDARQWPGYSTWLPLVATQVAARNGAAFGMRGVMAQNLQNSTAYAEAAREYRSWSARTQAETTRLRGESVDRNNREFRDNLGNVQRYQNPHDSKTPVELPNTYQYFWVNEQGTIVGTNDPGVNPNAGSINDWRKMPKQAP